MIWENSDEIVIEIINNVPVGIIKSNYAKIDVFKRNVNAVSQRNRVRITEQWCLCVNTIFAHAEIERIIDSAIAYRLNDFYIHNLL